MFEGYLTIKEASDQYEYAAEYIRQLCRDEKLEFKRISTMYLVLESSLIQYKEQSTRAPFERKKDIAV